MCSHDKERFPYAFFYWINKAMPTNSQSFFCCTILLRVLSLLSVMSYKRRHQIRCHAVMWPNGPSAFRVSFQVYIHTNGSDFPPLPYSLLFLFLFACPLNVTNSRSLNGNISAMMLLLQIMVSDILVAESSVVLCRDMMVERKQFNLILNA